jgi:hypothetical protein
MTDHSMAGALGEVIGRFASDVLAGLELSLRGLAHAATSRRVLANYRTFALTFFVLSVALHLAASFALLVLPAAVPPLGLRAVPPP